MLKLIKNEKEHKKKNYSYTIMLDKESLNILKQYCIDNDLNRSQVVRRALKKLGGYNEQNT